MLRICLCIITHIVDISKNFGFTTFRYVHYDLPCYLIYSVLGLYSALVSDLYFILCFVHLGMLHLFCHFVVFLADSYIVL